MMATALIRPALVCYHYFHHESLNKTAPNQVIRPLKLTLFDDIKLQNFISE